MKLVFIGRTQFLYETITKCASNNIIKAIITAEARPEYTKKESDFKTVAKYLRVPFSCLTSNRLDSILAKIGGADLGISINWPSILGQKEIDRFNIGILNAHFGDLPRYRGNACPNWAIINGEKWIYVSIHLMESDKLDSGRVITQGRMEINENTYISDVYGWAEKEIPVLFEKAIKLLKKDPEYKLKYADEKDSNSIRCYPRKYEDGKILWTNDAVAIHRLIRASGYPFNGAYSYLDGRKITILRAELVKDKEQYYAVTGQICRLGNKWFEVITGKGKLRIVQYSYSGRIYSIRQRLG